MAGTEDDASTVDGVALAEEAWSVAGLNSEIDAVLAAAADRFPRYVVGEVADVAEYEFATFFDLHDTDDESVISCIAWSGYRDEFDHEIAASTTVVVRAQVDFYADRGDCQLVVTGYWPLGKSDRARSVAELRATLREEGLLDEKRRRPLPEYPACIGVVTSASGSALEDFTAAVRERCPGATVKLCSATVQGEDAVPSVVGALRRLETDPEVELVAVTRGGGADGDLRCFDAEPVVRAVADCRTPVVVAVGHEDDETLAEAVADRRAMTPTDAGVAATPRLAAVREQVAGLERRIDGEYRRLVVDRLDALERPVETAFTALEHAAEAEALTARSARGRVGDLEARIDRAYRSRVDRDLAALETRIGTAYRDREADARVRAGTAQARRLRVVVALLLATLVLVVVAVAVLLP
jgi:exodeoxyribonuclease VII large subunit